MTGGAPPDGAFPWRAVGVLGSGLFGFGLAVGSFGTYVERLIATGVAPDAAGFGSTLFLLGQLAVVYPSDVLTRRYSVRTTAAAGLALGAVGTVLGGVLSVPANYAARLALGFGLSGTFLAAMKYGGRRAPRGKTARVQGVLGATFTLGLAVGIPVVPSAVGVAGPLVPAAVSALPVAAAALLAPTLCPVSTDGYRPPAAYVDAFRTPTGLALGLGNAASYGLLVVATTWYTGVVAAIPAFPATLVLAGFAAATFVGRTWSGWLTALTTERRAVGGALLFLATALGSVAAALAAGSAPLLGVGLVATGAGFGLPFGPLNSLAFANLGTDPGVLLVGMGVLGYGAALLYPWLVGWLLGTTRGYAAGFVVLAASVLAVAVAWWRVMCRPG
jgi:DHA1 family inner membrane transport protein